MKREAKRLVESGASGAWTPLIGGIYMVLLGGVVRSGWVAAVLLSASVSAQQAGDPASTPPAAAPPAAAPAPAPEAAATIQETPATATPEPAAAAATPTEPAAEPELPPDESGGELDLFELDSELKAETSVASLRSQSIREVPGVVSIITRDEIVDSGARDLMDVLMLVPGFSFNVDVENVIGVAFRGNWGHEGKVLLLIDGQEMNENLYSTLQFTGHYGVENIQRVEVIRGPGSAIYGGYAELAVINVVTRGPSELQGGRVAVDYGQYPSAPAYKTVSLEWAQDIKPVPGLSVSASAYFGQTERSDGVYKDFYGNSFSELTNGRSDPAFFNVGVNYKDLHLRFLYDETHMRTRDAYDEALEEPSPLNFRQLSFDAKYDIKINDKLTLTPRLSWTRHKPWFDDRTPEAPLYFDKTNDRYRARLTLNYDVTQWLALLAGADVWDDRAVTEGELTDVNTPFNEGDGRSVSFQNEAIFAEALVTHPIANVIVGARVENHSVVGLAVVPRVAVTKVIDKWNFKALYTRAFRAPGIQNIELGVNPKREYTQTFEGEIGYQFSSDVTASVNAFDVSIENPIVYFYDEENNQEGYANLGRTGTRGAEAELHIHHGKDLYVNASYSLAVANDNKVDAYVVAGDPNVMLGMPMHKVGLNAGFVVWRGLHVNPSGYFIGERKGFVAGDGEGNAKLGTAPPAVVLNLFLTYRDLGIHGLDVSAGVHDLLDMRPVYIQPYNSGHAPLPGEGRQVMLRVAYNFGL